MPRVTKAMLEVQIAALKEELEGHLDMLQDAHQELQRKCDDINELKGLSLLKDKRIEMLTEQICGFEEKFKQHIYKLHNGKESSIKSFSY